MTIRDVLAIIVYPPFSFVLIDYNRHFELSSIIDLSPFPFFISLALLGCGATKAVKMNQAAMKEAYQIQKPIIVRTSEDDDRPEWTKHTEFEKNGKVYFTGGFTDGANYAATIRCANAEALKTAVQTISQYIRAEFSEYVHGENSADGDGIERYFSDGIATFSENIHVQGMKKEKSMDLSIQHL